MAEMAGSAPGLVAGDRRQARGTAWGGAPVPVAGAAQAKRVHPGAPGCPAPRRGCWPRRREPLQAADGAPRHLDQIDRPFPKAPPASEHQSRQADSGAVIATKHILAPGDWPEAAW
jgi:hypothetical protein